MSNSISYVIETHGLAKAYKIEEPHWSWMPSSN